MVETWVGCHGFTKLGIALLESIHIWGIVEESTRFLLRVTPPSQYPSQSLHIRLSSSKKSYTSSHSPHQALKRCPHRKRSHPVQFQNPEPAHINQNPFSSILPSDPGEADRNDGVDTIGTSLARHRILPLPGHQV